MTIPAALFLADGSRFDGRGLDFEGLALGEAVFYTGMTGYEEALTDPSYAGQLLTFTYPMIGNYGISGTAAQYDRACVAGAIVKSVARHPSHHWSTTDLATWLREQRIPPAMEGADTHIAIALREHGTILAALAVGSDAMARAERELADYARTATTAGLVPSVATREGYVEGPEGGMRVTLLDCGVKRAILRDLTASARGSRSFRTTASETAIAATDPQAVFISPGPGDPTDLPQTIATLRGLLERVPLYGVCLGHQLLALACGARTYKLPYGHRGGNQPVRCWSAAT